LLFTSQTTLIGYPVLKTTSNTGWKMKEKSRLMLLACILLIACAITLIAAYTLKIEVGYVVASALALTGTVFWVNAD
jgi:hypothetical protein